MLMKIFKVAVFFILMIFSVLALSTCSNLTFNISREQKII